jgi:hypothetical protein
MIFAHPFSLELSSSRVDLDAMSQEWSGAHNGASTARQSLQPLRQTTPPRSTSIPFPSTHVARTQSELQLCLNQEDAEHRDVAMFYRLVSGIRERQALVNPSKEVAAQHDRSIASMIQTRMSGMQQQQQQPPAVLSPAQGVPRGFCSQDYYMQAPQAAMFSREGLAGYYAPTGTGYFPPQQGRAGQYMTVVFESPVAVPVQILAADDGWSIEGFDPNDPRQGAIFTLQPAPVSNKGPSDEDEDADEGVFDMDM